MASFGQAFSAARKAGKSTFSWNGKSYNTKVASDNSGPKKTSALPKSRDSAVSSKAKGPSFSGLSDVAKNGKKAIADIGNQKISRPVSSPSARGKGQAPKKDMNSFSENLKGAVKGFNKFTGADKVDTPKATAADKGVGVSGPSSRAGTRGYKPDVKIGPLEIGGNPASYTKMMKRKYQGDRIGK